MSFSVKTSWLPKKRSSFSCFPSQPSWLSVSERENCLHLHLQRSTCFLVQRQTSSGYIQTPCQVFWWDFLFRFGTTAEEPVLDLWPCKKYCHTLTRSKTHHLDIHIITKAFVTMRQFWINGIPLCLFLTNKDHNYLNAISSATNTRTLMFITQETTLPQKKQTKPTSIKIHYCSSSTSQANAH